MKRAAAALILVSALLPGFLAVSVPMMILFWATAGDRPRFRRRQGWVAFAGEAQHESIWARRWRYSTTFGVFIAYAPKHSILHESHEGNHVRQVYAVSVSALVSAGLAFASGSPWLALALWGFAWPVAYAGASLAAWACGEPAYEGNFFERAARALEEDH